MKIRTWHLFAIFCVVTMTSACSNDPMIKSSSSDQIIISAPPERFVAAFEIAKKKCEEHERKAQYAPDQATDLKTVAFNCLAPEAEAEVEETATETEE